MFTTAKHTTILTAGLLGTAMSGYLSYWSLFGPSCHEGPIPWLNCGSRVVTLIGLPTCVYGFFMFAAVVVLVGLAWGKSRSRFHDWLFWVAVVGVLFSAGLSVYEIWIIKLQKLPACVYGFFFYLIILTTTYLGRRKSAVHIDAPPTA